MSKPLRVSVDTASADRSLGLIIQSQRQKSRRNQTRVVKKARSRVEVDAPVGETRELSSTITIKAVSSRKGEAKVRLTAEAAHARYMEFDPRIKRPFFFKNVAWARKQIAREMSKI